MPLGYWRMSTWANTMTTNSNNPTESVGTKATDSVLSGALPDIDHLAQLANALFTALPCDGSRLTSAASVVSGTASANLAKVDNNRLTELLPQGLGLPGEAEIRHFLASQKPAFGGIPNNIDTESVQNHAFAQTAGQSLPTSLSSLEKKVLAGVFQHDFGLPDHTELQKLTASLPPSANNLIKQNALSEANQNLNEELPSSKDTYANHDISAQLFEAELQKHFAQNKTVTSKAEQSLPDNFTHDALTGYYPDFSKTVPALDTSLIAGLSPQNYGLPNDEDIKQFFSRSHERVIGSATENSQTESRLYFINDLKSDSFNKPILGFAHPPFNVELVRRDFPILQERVNGQQLVWFDNAATTQKPKVVIDRIAYFYEHENSNIHRAAHELAARATDAYEKARTTVARFINASSSDEIIFVRGTTEAINLVAQSWGRQNIGKGDEIIITWLEHHANIVPWQQLCAETGAVLRVAPVDDDGQVLLAEYQKLLTAKTKLVAFTQVSNALGTITPAQHMIEMAHRVGARVLLDGAQSVSHLQADVQSLDCDWFVFSGHKIFGPTGIGVVYGKPELLEAMPPWQGGGNMIEDVTFEKTTYQPAPAKFEAGTGNIADAVGLGAALEYVERLGINNIARYEHELLVYAMDRLRSIPGLRLIGTAPEKTSVLSFVLAGHSNQDVGVALNKAGIAVRTGHHCAQPILRRFGLESTVRPSLAFYNTHHEVDRLVDVIRKISGSQQNFSL